MTDFRVLRSEPLAQKAYVAFVQVCKGGSDDAGTYDADEEIVRHALKRLHELESAAMAEPEPEGPTDEELSRIYQSAYGRAWERGEFHSAHPDGLRAVLARWGNHPASPDSSTQQS